MAPHPAIWDRGSNESSLVRACQQPEAWGCWQKWDRELWSPCAPPPATGLSLQGSRPPCPLRGICPVVHSGCWTFHLISSIQLFNRSIKEAAVAVETKWMKAGGAVGLGCLPAGALQTSNERGALSSHPPPCLREPRK